MGDAAAKVSCQLRFDHGMQKIRRLTLRVERQQELDHVKHGFCLVLGGSIIFKPSAVKVASYQVHATAFERACSAVMRSHESAQARQA